MDIKTSRVLLVGATGGIGQKIASVLHYAGAKLVLVGRNEKKLDYVCASIEQQGDNKPDIIVADITSSAGRQAIVNAANHYPDGINVIINCAGINKFAMFEDLDEENIQQLINTNITAPFQLIQLLLPHLRNQPQATIMNVGSTFGTIGFAGFTVYSATKYAMRGFTEALRRELSDSNISVSYIAPRATDTELNTTGIISMNRELGVSVDQPVKVANEVLNALTEDIEEVYIGWPEKFFVKLNSIFPRLVDKALKKKLPVIRHYAKQVEFVN